MTKNEAKLAQLKEARLTLGRLLIEYYDISGDDKECFKLMLIENGLSMGQAKKLMKGYAYPEGAKKC